MLRHGRFLYVQIQPIIFVQFMLRIELLYNLGRVINTVPKNSVSEREVLNMITIKMNLESTTRKELAAAIAEIIGEEAIYRRTPTYSYGIGDITITRDGSLVFPDDSDILERLAEKGFIAEAAEDAQETAESPQEATTEEPDGLTVSLPKDGFTEAALENLQKLIAYSTNPNMFDGQPRMRIDGNFGGASAMTEALMQSTSDEIILLPALPVEWHTGQIKGLRAKNGFEVSMIWEDRKLKAAKIVSLCGQTCTIRTNSLISVFCDGSTVNSTAADGTVSFDTKKGNVYTIRS